MKKKNKHIGSSFDDFMKNDGVYEGATAHAVKRVLAWQLQQAMTERKITKAEMARRMKTSRSQIDRFLDPKNDSVQLDTIQKAAKVVGKRVVIGLEDVRV
jgi:antitoxin HicB